MGAWGGILLGFFGSMFATMTLALQPGRSGLLLALPFVVFAAIALAALVIIRRPGTGMTRSRRARRAILWSTLGEGVGLLVAANLVMALGHPGLLLPAVALVVGLHFLPMAHAIPFHAFYSLGSVLLVGAAAGFVAAPPVGGAIAGIAAAAALWTAALFALRRDWRARRNRANPLESRI